jgi:hypothetical protein
MHAAQANPKGVNKKNKKQRNREKSLICPKPPSFPDRTYILQIAANERSKCRA